MEESGLIGWALVAAGNRWALYAFVLLAVGSALFVLVVKPPQAIAASAASMGRKTAIAAILFYALGVGIGGADMIMGGPGAVLSGVAWRMGADTSLFLSALLGVPAMVLLGVGLAGESQRHVSALVAGATFAILSFLVTGHAATAEPVWLTAPTVALHLLCAAFWLGALWPLLVAARKLPPGEAGALMGRFSTRAIYSVTVLIASGAVIACVQMPGLKTFFTNYGYVLMVKLVLVGALLLLADRNRSVITPKMRAGDEIAASHMRHSILAEYAFYAGILAAAAALALFEPPRSL